MVGELGTRRPHCLRPPVPSLRQRLGRIRPRDRSGDNSGDDTRGDAGLVRLARLTELQWLRFGNTQVTDADNASEDTSAME